MPHAQEAWVGMIDGKRRRVAVLYNEHANPLRAPGSALVAKPFTVELCIPMRIGQDKVMKFKDEAEAKTAAGNSLLCFLSDIVEILK